MVEYKITVCPHDCPDSCSVRVGLEDGNIVSIAGDPDHPITRGFLCGKVNRYLERVNSPLRVLTPLRRVGAKGEGRFEPITWDQALDEISERFGSIIDDHGPQSILPYSYGGTIGMVQRNSGHHFFHRLGASRLDRTICVGSAKEGQRMTTGEQMGTDLEEIARSKLVILWGINAVATHIHVMPLIKEAKKAGAKLLVIDTYRNATARQADWFIQVRPGTDTALALGMMRIMLDEGLYDEDFVDSYTHGVESLREAALEYTPQRVAEITGVPTEDLVKLARMYGTTKASYIRMGGGATRHSHGGMMIRTIACLPSLTGAWEEPGGGFLCFGPARSWLNSAHNEAPLPSDPPARTLNMVRLGEILLEVDNPPVKAMYVYHANPAVIVPEQALVRQGLSRDDLFLVVHEQVLTDTTDYADIVLPATTFLEHDELQASYAHNYIQMSPKAVDPPGEAKSNLETFQLLAARMGLTEPRFRESFDSIVEGLLDGKGEPTRGLDRAALRAGRPVRMALPESPWRTGLQTPSGKFEFYSSSMEKSGQPPMPVFIPSDEGHLDNELKARYPLQLVTPPAQHFLNSSFAETDSSRRLEGIPTLKMNPTDADARGLAEGGECRAYNDRGECFLEVEVTTDVPAGVTVAEGLWWGKHHRGGHGINVLTSAELTDLGGCARFHDGLIQVEPAAG